MVRKLSEYKQLKRISGDFADETVEAMWGKFAMNGKASHMNSSADKLNYKKAMASTLQGEINNLLGGHYHIGNLLVQASGSTMGQKLRQNPLQPQDYGADANDTELVKAAKWIVHGSNTLRNAGNDENAPVNLTKIRAAMEHVVGNMDIKNWNAILYLHQRLVDQNGLKTSRGPSAEVKYCSTGGGRYLLNRSFEMLAGISSPPNDDDKWDSMACFVIGSIIRSHGFTDGNGRAARGMFACVLLKGGRTFVPIKSNLEKTLHGL